MTSQSKLAQNLHADGLCILQGAVNSSTINDMRSLALSNICLLRNTRENPNSGHLAGFHRYPCLERMHTLLSCSRPVESILAEAMPDCRFRAIGLSDITVNRSQEWHVDLLRGRFRSFLDQGVIWDKTKGGGVFKVLLYLQSGKSLRYIPGSHLTESSLEYDSEPRLVARRSIYQADVEAGDIVLIDIRLAHRGSTQAESNSPGLSESPKILVSTVLGSCDHDLTGQMELGNASRQSHWDDQNRYKPSPRLSVNAS